MTTAFCLWIPLCCFYIFPTLIIPSSLIKLQISSLPYSFSSPNHWCSCSHRAWWFCMLSRSLQLVCRCVSLSSPCERCYPLSARRRKHKAPFSSGVRRVWLWVLNCQAWAFLHAAAELQCCWLLEFTHMHSWKRSNQCNIGLNENWFIMHVALPAGSWLSSQLWPDVCWRASGMHTALKGGLDDL